MKPLRFHRNAREELHEAGRYYAGIHPDLGRQFYGAVDNLVKEIRTHPTAFRVFEPPARRHFGPRFPYSVVYVDFPDRVWVVAIMHFKQRPGYWIERLEM